MKKMVIKGTGRYLPERIVTNDDLSKFMDTSDEWIQQRTGIEERRWVSEEDNLCTSDLGVEASKIALSRAGWVPEDIDLIIFATLSPDIFFPGSGCILQSKLGLKSTPAIDIRQQCTGFLYGFEMADAYIKSGHANKILVVGAEVHSTGLEMATRGRDVTVIFGDGAGAVCVEGVETDENVGLLATSLHAQGDYAEALMTEAPASRNHPRLSKEDFDAGKHFPTMDGKNVFKLAVRRLPEVTQKVLDKAGLTLDDIDMVIPHQANLRINQFYQKSMNIPDEKIYNNIQKYGNTTAGTIPIALDEVIEKKLISPEKSTVIFSGLGAGLTWGAMIFRFM